MTLGKERGCFRRFYTLPCCPGFLWTRQGWPDWEEGRWREQLPRVLPTLGSPNLVTDGLSLLHCRANVPAKPCTPLTRRTCRTSAPAALPHRRSPCGCPCTVPTAPSSTTRSSMPCTASAPPGSAASEGPAAGPDARHRPPRPCWPGVLPHPPHALLLCPPRPAIKASFSSGKRLMAHCVFWAEMTTAGWAGVRHWF